MESGRIIIDGLAHGSWNMAVDESLLIHSELARTCTLRIYRWEPATLSLGYFQPYEERKSHVHSRGCDLVRRVTGGGAIMHHHELTYSLVVPSNQRWSVKNEALYTVVHSAIQNALSNFNVNTSICAESADESKKRFLCFQRRTKGDLLLGEHKIGGSAQRRMRSALLQHGSLLLSKSEFAPELPGIFELANSSFDLSEFLSAWVEHLSKTLNVEFVAGEYTAEEIESSKQVEHTKFASVQWNQKR